MPGMLKAPLSLVVVVRAAPVASLVAVTAAPGSAPPWLSLTLPASTPVPACPEAVPDAAVTRRTHRGTHTRHRAHSATFHLPCIRASARAPLHMRLEAVQREREPPPEHIGRQSPLMP